MSIWLLSGVVAFAAATLLWHGVAKTKQSSEALLGEYAKLLAKAREEKETQAAETGKDQQQDEESGEAKARESPA